MTKNDILRRLRYALQINDGQVAKMIAKTGKDSSAGEVASWLKREDEPGFVEISDAIPNTTARRQEGCQD
jgi:uncharacterized protein YehS (DUF1456 family)